MSFTLPDLVAICPFVRQRNPHYPVVSTESSEWVLGFNILDDVKRALFVQIDYGLFTAYVYPNADEERFKTCCDFINILFALDDISDGMSSADASQMMVNVAAKAMKDPQFDDSSSICAMMKQFTARLAQMPPLAYQRFVKHFEDYCIAVGEEATIREQRTFLDLESYRTLRRDNGCVKPCFDLFADVLGVDLPEDILVHPMIMSLYNNALDMISWSNDLVSYARERAMGHSRVNILSVLMEERNISLQEAADETGILFKGLVDDFMNCKANLPSFGLEWDRAIVQIVKLLESWVIGNIIWSFEASRYFGADAGKVKDTLVVEVSPM